MVEAIDDDIQQLYHGSALPVEPQEALRRRCYSDGVDYDFDRGKAFRLDYFRKGFVQEDALREYLELWAVLRVQKGFGPSQVRKCDIHGARLLVEMPILKKSANRRQRQAKVADKRHAAEKATHGRPPDYDTA